MNEILPRHFGALDFYRFIAAVGVVAHHFSGFAKYDPDAGFGYIVGNFGLFVDFFFILSGFVIGLTYCDSVATLFGIFTFLRRRIARIYPLHLLTFLIFLSPALFGLSRHDPDKLKAFSIIKELILVQSWQINVSMLPLNFPAWSISVEWFLYLLFPAIIWLRHRTGIWALFVVATLGFAGMEFALIAGLAKPPLFNPLPAIPTFAIGVLISQTFGKFDIGHGALSGFVVFCISVLLMALHANHYVVLALFSLTVILTVCGRSSSLFEKHICAELGNASYSVYMLHAIFLSIFVDKLWPKLSNDPVSLWYGLVVLGFIVATSILTFRFFERPARYFISGSATRRAPLPLSP